MLGEYVAFKEADTRRKRAVASNPLAKRMYDVLEECATGATRVPAETSEPVVPASDAAAESRGRARASRETLAPRDARLAANDSRARGIPASPSPAVAAMPPPPARSPHRGKKRGGAVPRRNAPVTAAAAAGFGDGVGAGSTAKKTEDVFGSLDDFSDSAPTWRNVELPRALNDARVQERLAAVIADRIPTLDVGEGRPSDTELFAGFAAQKPNSKRRKSAHGDADASPAGTPPKRARGGGGGGGAPATEVGVASPDPAELGGLDVDAVMQSLFENDADGTLGEILGPLLGAPSPRAEHLKNRASGKPSPDPSAKRRLRLGSGASPDESAANKIERDPSRGGVVKNPVPAHVRALDVDAFVKSIEY